MACAQMLWRLWRLSMQLCMRLPAGSGSSTGAPPRRRKPHTNESIHILISKVKMQCVGQLSQLSHPPQPRRPCLLNNFRLHSRRVRDLDHLLMPRNLKSPLLMPQDPRLPSQRLISCCRLPQANHGNPSQVTSSTYRPFCCFLGGRKMHDFVNAYGLGQSRRTLWEPEPL